MRKALTHLVGVIELPEYFAVGIAYPTTGPDQPAIAERPYGWQGTSGELVLSQRWMALRCSAAW